MTIVPYQIQPGIVKDTTEVEVGSRYWTDGKNVRFRFGHPEPVGGHEKEANWSFTGKPRKALSWQTNSLDRVTAVGTTSHLYIVLNDERYDITPLRATSAGLSNPFTTTDTSAEVTVTDTTHGAAAGDYIVISGASAVNGITPDGEYVIDSVTDADNYVITHSEAATGTGSGGGTVTIEYLIQTGTDMPVAGLGWGASQWSNETWGDERSSSTIVAQETTLWSLDVWGEDLVACRVNGAIYLWDASVGTGTRAAVLTNSPTSARFVVISNPDRHVVAFGAHDGTFQDYMNVAWSDQEDNTTWTPAATNTAGDFRVKIGTKLVTAVSTQDTILVLTDDAAYQQYFQGPPFTFGFRSVGTSCGALSQNSLVDIAGIPHWVGIENFFQFTGSVKTLACPIRRYVFDDLNQSHRDKVFSGKNEKYNEWWVFYPSGTSTECDKFAIFNYAEGHWSIGELSRTAWTDRESYLNDPIAFDSDGNQYYHERGTNADTSALDNYVESGYISLTEQTGAEADRLILVDSFIPDFEDLTGTVTLTVTTKKYPQTSETVKGPFDITSSTQKVDFRAKGRQFKIKIASNELGADWRSGKIRMNVKPSSGR